MKKWSLGFLALFVLLLTVSPLIAGELDASVEGLWLELPGFPADAEEIDFEMNDEGVASYTRFYDDAMVVLVVERLETTNLDDEEIMPENIGELVAYFEDIDEEDINVTEDLDEFANLLSYPVAGAEYETGENEDTRKCADLFVFTDSWLFRVHLSIDADAFDDYSDEAMEWLQSLQFRE